MKFNDKSDKSEKSSTELLMNQMQIGIMQVTITIGHLWSCTFGHHLSWTQFSWMQLLISLDFLS